MKLCNIDGAVYGRRRALLLRGGLATAVALLVVLPLSHAGEGAAGAQRYTFSWLFEEGDRMAPRGGSSKGPPVQLLRETREAFRRIQAQDLSAFERDRRAILAMAGDYRVSFDFLEVAGYAPDYTPSAPYQSWGTERVYVLADEGERIVLQHVLVMRVLDEDGEVIGPFVTKHWRQDWRFEARQAHVYAGHNTWARQRIDAEAAEGRWLQTVWQVDDSPRYAAWGRWQHTPERSSWLSGQTLRPLPRREFSVRDDYDALQGTNRHVVTATGWHQEERNDKIVLDAAGAVARRLATEYGMARYERIKDYDFGPGDAYLAATKPFWALVRERWAELMAASDRITLKARPDQGGLYRPLFRRAQEIADGDAFDPEADARRVRERIDAYFAGSPGSGAGY